MSDYEFTYTDGYDNATDDWKEKLEVIKKKLLSGVNDMENGGIIESGTFSNFHANAMRNLIKKVFKEEIHKKE